MKKLKLFHKTVLRLGTQGEPFDCSTDSKTGIGQISQNSRLVELDGILILSHTLIFHMKKLRSGKVT